MYLQSRLINAGISKGQAAGHVPNEATAVRVS